MSPPTRPARVLAFGHAGTVGTRFGLVASSNSFFGIFLFQRLWWNGRMLDGCRWTMLLSLRWVLAVGQLRKASSTPWLRPCLLSPCRGHDLQGAWHAHPVRFALHLRRRRHRLRGRVLHPRRRPVRDLPPDPGAGRSRRRHRLRPGPDQPAHFTLLARRAARASRLALVSVFEQGDTGFRRTRYRAVVEPPLARLALGSDWRIFQQRSVPQILQALLAEHGIEHYAQNLTEEHLPREYCVQAGDTDLTSCSAWPPRRACSTASSMTTRRAAHPRRPPLHPWHHRRRPGALQPHPRRRCARAGAASLHLHRAGAYRPPDPARLHLQAPAL